MSIADRALAAYESEMEEKRLADELYDLYRRLRDGAE